MSAHGTPNEMVEAFMREADSPKFRDELKAAAAKFPGLGPVRAIRKSGGRPSGATTRPPPPTPSEHIPAEDVGRTVSKSWVSRHRRAIIFHASRGMSRQSLSAIYGRDTVFAVLGSP